MIDRGLYSLQEEWDFFGGGYLNGGDSDQNYDYPSPEKYDDE